MRIHVVLEATRSAEKLKELIRETLSEQFAAAHVTIIHRPTSTTAFDKLHEEGLDAADLAIEERKRTDADFSVWVRPLKHDIPLRTGRKMGEVAIVTIAVVHQGGVGTVHFSVLGDLVRARPENAQRLLELTHTATEVTRPRTKDARHDEARKIADAIIATIMRELLSARRGT